MVEFSISGIETYWWMPILVSFIISSVTSMGGVSGAFLLLPFQVSILGFSSPAVSPTNLIFNVMAIPSGVYRYYREKRMILPIAWVVILGTLPGVFLGAIIRIHYLPDPKSFKLFAGLVLLYIAIRLVKSILRTVKQNEKNMSDKGGFQAVPLQFNTRKIKYQFNNQTYSASTPGVFVLSFIVGIIGGTYGIGGGAIIAPFLVTVFRLSVHSIAGAALLGTFLTSISGVVFYTLIAPFYAGSGLAIQPDWLLGILFGIGGFIGIYFGARVQKYVPEKAINVLLAICVLFISLKYISSFFL